VAKYPLFRGNFVLWYAILDSASVRCSELRGGLFSEVCFVLKHAKINPCFSEWPLEGGNPLLGGSVNRGSTVFIYEHKLLEYPV